MDSLDPLPSAEYASLLTLSPPTNTAAQQEFDSVDDNQNITKPTPQDHIYAQVTQTVPPKDTARASPKSKDNDEVHCKVNSKPNKVLLHNTYVLRNPSLVLSHSNSAPDVRKSNVNLPSLCPNNYGSLNATKVERTRKDKKADPIADPSVFSISGRRVVVSSGFKGNDSRKKSTDPKDQIFVSNHSNENPSLWSRSPSTDSETEVKRRKLQVCTDCFSLCLFIPGTVLCILSPWLLVPIYIIPNLSGSHFHTFVWVTCIGSAILVFMGCIVGNVVWYRKGQEWKCLLHCGRGPRNHYWGDSLTARTLHTV